MLHYHLGTFAFGAFVLATVQFLRYMMKYLEMQAKAQKNCVMRVVFRIIGYFVWCFEKCIRFLNKNAYIQCAILGTNFCVSAKNAFFLILRNITRFGTVTMLGSVVHLLGTVFIMVITTAIGYIILSLVHPEEDVIAPV